MLCRPKTLPLRTTEQCYAKLHTAGAFPSLVQRSTVSGLLPRWTVEFTCGEYVLYLSTKGPPSTEGSVVTPYYSIQRGQLLPSGAAASGPRSASYQQHLGGKNPRFPEVAKVLLGSQGTLMYVPT